MPAKRSSLSELDLTVSLCSQWTEQSIAQGYPPHLFQTWALACVKLHLTCVGFSLLAVQARWLQVLRHRYQHLVRWIPRWESSDNTNGLTIMACNCEGLVTGLFPSEMSRLASSLLGFRLPEHGEVHILSSHLICQSYKTDVSWEEAKRCRWDCSSHSYLSHYGFLQNRASHQPLVFDIGYGLLPARKRTKNVTLKMAQEQRSYSFSTWNCWVEAMLFIQNNFGWNSFD